MFPRSAALLRNAAVLRSNAIIRETARISRRKHTPCSQVLLRDFSSQRDGPHEKVQKLRDFAKRYGIVGIGTHTGLGAVWFGAIYTSIGMGVDVQAVSAVTTILSALSRVALVIMQIFEGVGLDLNLSSTTSNMMATFVAYKVALCEQRS